MHRTSQRRDALLWSCAGPAVPNKHKMRCMMKLMASEDRVYEDIVFSLLARPRQSTTTKRARPRQSGAAYGG